MNLSWILGLNFGTQTIYSHICLSPHIIVTQILFHFTTNCILKLFWVLCWNKILDTSGRMRFIWFSNYFASTVEFYTLNISIYEKGKKVFNINMYKIFTTDDYTTPSLSLLFLFISFKCNRSCWYAEPPFPQSPVPSLCASFPWRWKHCKYLQEH